MQKEYIERVALEKQLNERLKNLRKENGYYDHYTDGYDEAVDTVENAPTDDVAPVVHGEWEDKQNPQWKAHNIRHCGVCGWNIPKSKLRNKDLHWNYCPNCGAKMDGGKT